MAHNFSNLEEIHRCPCFITRCYWIIKQDYFLKIEQVSLPPPRLFLCTSMGSAAGEGPGIQAQVALFIPDCVIGPCRQRLISHCEFPYQRSPAPGGKTREEIASRCHLASSVALREALWKPAKSKGLESQPRV